MSHQHEPCPICTFSGESETEVYTHILTSHRKSAITGVLLETQPAHSPSR